MLNREKQITAPHHIRQLHEGVVPYVLQGRWDIIELQRRTGW